MNNDMNRYLKNRSMSVIILLSIIVNLTVSWIFSLLSILIRHKSINNEFLSFDSMFEELLIIIIASPIVETFIFQYLPFKVLGKYIFKTYLIIIISAIIFGLAHTYNALYMVNGFFSGLIFSYTYFICGQKWRGFIGAALSHIGYNAAAYVLNHV